MGEADEDDDDFSSDSSDFINHMEAEHEPLYPGCENYTKMKALVKLFNLKVKHGMSDSYFSDVLLLIGSLLPDGNNIPSSFNEAKKTLYALGMGYEKIHACPNNCLLYRRQIDEDETTCHICKASRWKLNKKGEEQKGVPAKVLWYFPLIPRIRNLFNTPQIAKDMTWHETEREQDGKLRHLADSQTWKNVDQEWPDFASESRNLRLALSSDGFNPFHGNRTEYSIWPVLLSVYNLPPWLCMKRKYIMLCLLISGPTEPGNDIDVFLQPLIEDLQELWRGKQVYDAYKQENFLLRGILLWTISDYPALGNLSGNVIKGYNACTICVDNRKATRLVHYRKTVIMRHMRWLPRHHPYRKQKSAFDNTVEKGVAPIPLTGEARPVWKKVSIFFQLEYSKFLPVRHVLDVMHIEKNICESLLGTLLNIPGKIKDRESVRLDMADMGIRMELRPKTPGKKEKLVETLCQLEKHFPLSFFDVMIHLSIHLVREVKLCGPIFLDWIYPFERYMKAFKGYVRNPAHPEGYITEAYVVEKAVECLVNFEEATIGLPKKGRDEQNGITRPLSGATIIKPSNEDLQLAHICFLEHMASLMERYPHHENDPIETELLHDHNGITDEIRWIAEGPNKIVPTFSGYRINGVSYSTKDRDDNRQVQCSGVSVVADTLMLVEKDNTVEHTAQTYYGVITSIWDLDYNKFRVPIFRCNWVDINKGVKVDDLGFILVNLNKLGFVNDPFVLGKHVKQVCYIDDPLEKFWYVVLKLPEKNFNDHSDEENDGYIEIELENELQTPLFPNMDEHDDENASYMREEEEWIQLP
ncbi:uncharacterized protein LOC141719728 [Apium graveolens]|uniref:uncharacterized protein LOC141719728 n=1 Tax=Apium graveolens TaxID=4045 RepID=UPI003D7BDA68